MTTSMPSIEWVEQCRKQDCNSYVLVDSAQAQECHSTLVRRGTEFSSLFAQSSEDHLIEIAPILIALDELSIGELDIVCEWATQLARAAPCLSWMSSRLTLEQLAEHFRQFHKVGVSDGQMMMLRWYDTRILPVWLSCLDSKQHQNFVAGIQNLYCINRFGESINLHSSVRVSPPSDTSELGAPLIHLSDRQYAMLVDASQIDTLVSHLRRIITDELNQLPPRSLFEFVNKFQQLAIRCGVDDLDRQAQYILLALYTSGFGTAHASCEELMAAPPRSLDDFFAAMQRLPDAAWNAGPPLWKRPL